MEYGRMPEVEDVSSFSTDTGEVIYRVFAIGDAGYRVNASEANLKALSQRLARADKKSSLVFLGDNLYPEGLAGSEDIADRERGMDILSWQIKAADGFKGEIYVIAGNHDWKKGKPGGLKTLKRQEDFIQEYDRKDLHFEPEAGCPGPEEVKLTDDLTLLLIDSQWWLQNWENDRDINRDCDLHTRLDFLAAFEEALKDNKEKQVIVALHHPLYTFGDHGGYFTMKDHFFPLTNLNPDLYIPLPLVGSLYPVLRGNFGHIQDLAHPKYHDLKESLLERTALYENVIFISGHEHNLQYIKRNGHHFLVSGSGSKVTPLAKGKGMVYGNTVRGFMELEYLSTGSVRLLIWETPNGSVEPVLGYARVIVPSREGKIAEAEDFKIEQHLPDSMTSSIAPASEKGTVHNLIFGKHYRELYNMNVRAPVLDLSTVKGGLFVVKKGGGFQTNSLRLEADDGRQYVLRSLRKDATRILPPAFQSTFAIDVLQDQFTASHPFAAFALPGMAKAAGIYYTHPKFVYVPRQNGLGKYNPDFGDALYLFEERPDGDWSDQESFGNSNEVISTGKVIEEDFEKFNRHIDQEFTLRSRLFDMVIGDWDRHDDQWRWASLENPDGGGTLYRPIPRDRDQAFSSYGGIMLKLASWYTPHLRKMHNFTGDIRRINWYNYNARFFDRHFLNMLGRGTWLVTANTLRAQLSDEVIETNIRENWPPGVYEKHGPSIISTLKTRRDNILDFANRYYSYLAEEVDIVGTDDADVFQVHWIDAGLIRVKVFDKSSDDRADELYYERTFLPEETDEIRLYPLEGKDIIQFLGSGKSPILVRVVGGPGKDEYVLEQRDFSGRLAIQDKPNKSKISPSLRRYYKEIESDFKNSYDRESVEYDVWMPVISLAANDDDGFLIGGGVDWTNHGFQKKPFASKHRLEGQIALSSAAYLFAYDGMWSDLIGTIDGSLNILLQGPTYVRNFFGYGNTTTSLEVEDELDYYRVKIRKFGLTPGLVKTFGTHAGVALEGLAYITRVEETPGRFIADPTNGVSDYVFDNQIYAGYNFKFYFNRVDHPQMTRRGIKFQLQTGMESRTDNGETHRWLKSELSMYFGFRHLGKPVLATRIGTEFHGGDYAFFQAATLGGGQTHRGMRKERFTGDKVFYHNTDLRWPLFRWHNYYMPGVLGLVASFDHGRVWLNSEEDNGWHYAYGGGIWISPFQALVMRLDYHRSDVDNRFSFGMGFFF